MAAPVKVHVCQGICVQLPGFLSISKIAYGILGHMKQGGRFAKKSAGFTIVETMIVLAVSAGLFLIAALYIGGKQAKTEFQVGVRDIQTQLQQIINQTESGYYGLQDRSCSANASGLHLSTGGSLGTSGECIFIGKAIVVDSTKLYVYPLAGARLKAGADTTSAVDADATVAGSPETFTIPNGIELFTSSYDSGVLASGLRGFAVLSSMSKGSDSAEGSQTFGLHGFNGNGSFSLPANFETVINNEKIVSPVSNAYTLLKSVNLCMKSGGTDQSALIVIGGNSGLAIHTEIKSGATCGA